MVPPRRSRNVPWGIVGLTSGAVVVLGSVLVLRARSADPAPEPSSSAVGPTGANIESVLGDPGAPLPTGAGANGNGTDNPGLPHDTRSQVLAAPNLQSAITVARPSMSNTVGRIDAGTAYLALWAAGNLTWDALDAIPATSPAMFAKDQDAERGKRLCVTGTIVEIRAERSLAGRIADDRASPLITSRPYTSPSVPSAYSTEQQAARPLDSSGSLIPAAPPGVLGDWAIPGDGKVFVAVLKEKKAEVAHAEGTARPVRRANRDELVVEVIAVKSTGALVDHSDARACGVLTGVSLPSTGLVSLPPDITLHRIVGLFDLPQNH